MLAENLLLLVLNCINNPFKWQEANNTLNAALTPPLCLNLVSFLPWHWSSLSFRGWEWWWLLTMRTRWGSPFSRCRRTTSNLRIRFGFGRDKLLSTNICFIRLSALDSFWACATIFPSPWVSLISLKQSFSICKTFGTGQAGFSVYKYVPYGPVNEVLPYLSR